MIELREIDISQITSRERFRENYGDISILIDSIKTEGIIQPLAVKRISDSTYQLLAGGRRLKACMEAGIKEIPVRVYPDTITNLEMRSIELMENVARKDLDWLEASRLKDEINSLQIEIHGEKRSTAVDATGWSGRDTAKLLGVSHTAVSDAITLSKAVNIFPQLKAAKTQNDATKMLRRLQSNVVQEEIARRLSEKKASTPIEEQLQNLCNRFIVADFFDGVKKLPDGSIDIVEMDPPYGIDITAVRKIEGIDPKLHLQYNEVPHKEYTVFIDNVLKELYRVMSADSWLIIWYVMTPWSEIIHNLLEKNGFFTKRIPGIWYKGEGQLQCMHPDIYMANAYEPFFYASKGKPTIKKKGRSNVFHFKTVTSVRRIHPTERPIEMIQEVLSVFSWDGARILVPFLGSGNTILAAANLGIQAFGFELTSEYRDAYIMRVHESRPGSYHSYA